MHYKHKSSKSKPSWRHENVPFLFFAAALIASGSGLFGDVTGAPDPFEEGLLTPVERIVKEAASGGPPPAPAATPATAPAAAPVPVAGSGGETPAPGMEVGEDGQAPSTNNAPPKRQRTVDFSETPAPAIISGEWNGKFAVSAAPLGPVLRLLARHCGYNYIEPPDPNGALESELVTMRLDGVTPEEAFVAVTRSRGFKIQNENGIVNLLRPDMFVSEYVYAQAYPLKHLEVLWVLQDVANLVGVEITPPAETLSTYPDPTDQYSASSDSSAGTSGGTGDSSGSGTVGGVATGGGVPNEPRWLPSLPYDAPLSKGGFRQSEGEKDETVVFADRRRNAIVLRGSRQEHDTVAEYIASIDKPEPQILVHARIVEVSNIKDLNAGIDWSSALNDPGLAFRVRTLPQANEALLESGEFLFYPGGVILDWPNAEVVFRAFERKNLFKNLAQPSVITRSGVPVAIRSTRSEYVEQFTSTAPAGEGAVADSQFTSGFQSFQTGITIDVVGRILENGFIDINVNPVVAQQAGRSSPTRSNPDGLPIIDTRSAQTTVRVRSGDTIVIGGITRVSDSQTKSGIPILASIPVLGDYIFGNRNVDDIKSNLLIFVTPRIVGVEQTTSADLTPAEADFMHKADTISPPYRIIDIDPPKGKKKKNKREVVPSAPRAIPVDNVAPRAVPAEMPPAPQERKRFLGVF